MLILWKNWLVDFGVKGFYYFIIGFINVYCGKVVFDFVCFMEVE